MPFGRAKTPEELAADEALKARQQETKAKLQAAREWEQFMRSPQGLARQAYEAGDHLFQIGLDVMSQQAVIVKMIGSMAPQQTSDPSVVLNAITGEGWDLINGSFVFVQQRQQSRDKFMSSGQNIAIEGTTMGYYVFRRNPALKTA